MILLGKANPEGFAQMCRIAHKVTAGRQWRSVSHPSAFIAKASREALETVTGPGCPRPTLSQGLLRGAVLAAACSAPALSRLVADLS